VKIKENKQKAVGIGRIFRTGLYAALCCDCSPQRHSRCEIQALMPEFGQKLRF